MKAHRSVLHFGSITSLCFAGSIPIRSTQPQNKLLREMQRVLLLLLIFALGLPFAVQAESELRNYAIQCENETHIAVPPFKCDDPDSTLVPMTNAFDKNNNPLLFGPNADFVDLYSKVKFGSGGGRCDRPDRLNKECDPGSRFHVLAKTADAYVVAHCRKKGNPNNTWGDIAVIQHNTKNGATCFYQEGPTDGLSNDVKAPIAPGPNEWRTPAGTVEGGCVECHDNGPIIRSPYLTQITGPNRLPGADDTCSTPDCRTFNRDPQPYYFVGSDFASWKVFKVEIKNNVCNTCHRLGVSNRGNGGTARDFGIRATQEQPEPGKNPHSPASPIWMTPGQITFDPENGNAKAAQAIKECALKFNEQHQPNSDTCRITEYTGAGNPPPLCPTEVRILTDLNESKTTFNWSTPSDVDHLNIRRNGVMGPSGLLIFPDGKSVLSPTTTTVTVPFDQDYLATYNVCTVGGDAQTCCTEPITPRRRLCVEVAKCRIHGREVLPTDTDDPNTWCSSIGGRIHHFLECSTSGGGTTDTPLD
jgi:hypothetical protein